jgi:tetratricopeptide (TPR) repeat protein
MGHSSFKVAALVATTALLLLLSGCGGSEHSVDSASSSSMTPAEARGFVAQVLRERGIPIDTTPVANLDQLLEALTADQVGRFASAEQLVAGKPGIDALALHASIELAWSDDLVSFARILEELGKRAEFEVKRLSTKRESSLPLTDAEKKALEQSEKNVAFDAKAKLALEVLAAERLNAASALVDQTLRQFPKHPSTYRGAAYFSLLSREWPNFDAAMSWLVEGEGKDAGLVYLRGFEALKRRRSPAQATALFQEALRLNPQFVRAQAKLVLSAADIDTRYGEFEKLRELAPQHPLVSLLGPSITSDYELSSSVRQARAAQKAPASLEPEDSATLPPDR